ncbi:MAG: ABC transporter ATP-binding protein [Candidatus Alkaliphilus sp. MAG34]
MGSIYFENIVKSFGKRTVLKDINIEIKDGELFTFLGPSGCGKTTLLRILAGFEKPDSGTVRLDDKDITDLIPEKRGISMVFQNYALFPNMNVAENVGYGLKARRINKKVIREKVEHYLNMVGMLKFSDRDINELSGGEQQRVCIARALAIDPKVLLLDEPLSNLDAKLREKMRIEIKELQDKLGITTIFVSHDQQEAMSISDRIAVLNEGEPVQIDTPFDLYNNPKSEFVASFIGESNIIHKSDFEHFFIDMNGAEKVCIRPQDFRISDNGPIWGEVTGVNFNGGHINYHCSVNGCGIKISEMNLYNKAIIDVGQNVSIQIDKNAVRNLYR